MAIRVLAEVTSRRGLRQAGPMAALAGGVRLALAFLTIIPVPATAQVGRREAAVAMVLAPLAVLPVALVAAGLGQAALLLGMTPVLAGVVVVSTLAIGTRAMHLDGLADTVDGLGSGPDRAKALQILRSGDVGPMGVVALVLVLIAEVSATGGLLTRPLGWAVLATAVAVSRSALMLGCLRGLPPARPDGLGALFAGSVPVPVAALGWVLSAAALTAASVGLAGIPWWQPVAGVTAALVLVWWVLRRCVARFGGVSGDVLGAVVELSFAVVVVALAA